VMFADAHGGRADMQVCVAVFGLGGVGGIGVGGESVIGQADAAGIALADTQFGQGDGGLIEAEQNGCAVVFNDDDIAACRRAAARPVGGGGPVIGAGAGDG